MKNVVLGRQVRLLSAVICGLLAVILCGVTVRWLYAPLFGWDVAAVTLLVLLWVDLGGHDRHSTAETARRDDMNHSLVDWIVILASLASMVAVGVLLTSHGDSNKSRQLLEVGFGLVSIIISWATVHSLYTVRYAAMYYRDTDGGVDFGQTKHPRFADFAYIAFTIGMTYQVSDTTFQTSAFRRVALGHALLSFVFGTAIIATTINFIASLSG